MLSSLWELCCPTGQNSHDAFDVKVRGVQDVSSDLLRVAVWNAAGFDNEVQKKYHAEVKRTNGHPQNCRKANEAAKHFWDHKFDVVIVPECDDETGTKFKTKKFGNHNTETAFTNQGFMKVSARKTEFKIVDKNTCIFYRSDTLEPVGLEWGSKDCMPGTGEHPGKVVGKAFKTKKNQDWILITAVHAGHYGRDDKLVSSFHSRKETQHVKQARQDVQGLREFQTNFLQSWDFEGRTHRDWSKVIVAGDFNELGNLISEDPKQFCPLPKGFEYTGTYGTGITVSDHGKYDHIWWGTSHPEIPVKTGNNIFVWKGDKFGSDHNCVMAQNI